MFHLDISNGFSVYTFCSQLQSADKWMFEVHVKRSSLKRQEGMNKREREKKQQPVTVLHDKMSEAVTHSDRWPPQKSLETSCQIVVSSALCCYLPSDPQSLTLNCWQIAFLTWLAADWHTWWWTWKNKTKSAYRSWFSIKSGVPLKNTNGV